MKYLNSRKLLHITVFCFIFIACFLFLQNKSYAAYLSGQGPAGGASISPGGQAWYAVGTGNCSVSPSCSDGFNGQQMAVQVYMTNSNPSAVSQTINLSIQSPGAGCGSEDSTRKAGSGTTLYQVYDGLSGSVRASVSANNDGSSCGTINKTVTSSTKHSAKINGKDVYYVTVFIQLLSPLDYMENSFRISAVNEPGETAYVSFVHSNSYGDYTGIYRRDLLNGNWSESLVFAPPCSLSGGGNTQTVPIKWFDADFNEYNPGLNIVLYQADKGGSNWSEIRRWNDANSIGNSGSTRSYDVTFNKDKQYRLDWLGLSWINTIQVQLPYAQINAIADPCLGPNPVDLCLNITGVQDLAYIASHNLTKSTPGNQPGNCFNKNPPPPEPNSCSFDIGGANTSVDVSMNQPFSFGISARNGGNTVWDKSTNKSVSPWHITAFITVNNPSPYAGYVAKFGETLPTLSQFQNSPYVNVGVNTSTPGTQVFRYYLVWLDTYNPVTQPFNYIEGDANRPSCTMTVNVKPGPPTGNITSANCQTVNFNVGWTTPWGGSPPVHYRITVEGGRLEGDGSGAISRGTFNEIDTTDPLHLPSYDVILELRDSDGNWLPFPVDTSSFNGPCINNFICKSASVSWEYDPAKPYTLSFGITNDSSRSDNRYSFAISNPPGGLITGIQPGTPANDHSVSFIPDTSTNIIVNLRFNGAPIGYTINCRVTVNRYPYIKAYGGSVVSGGSFQPNCTANQGGIFARMRDIANQPGRNQSGSGAQLADLANTVSGFASGVIGNTNPNPSPGNFLSIGGVGATPGGSIQQTLANGYNTSLYCLPDYWSMQYPNGDPRKVNAVDKWMSIGEARPGDPSPADEPAEHQIYYKPTAVDNSVTFNPSSGGGAYTDPDKAISGRRTYFIDGDAFILKNIFYTNSDSSYGQIDKIPNFTLIVRGNLYIHQNINRLDGIYIAQDDGSGNKGKIYTCAYGGRVTGSTGLIITSPNGLYTDCSGGYGDPAHTTPTLTVNGSMIAKTLITNRAVNTLADSKYKELSGATKAAENFIFSPELYISPPILDVTKTQGSFDSQGILPPLL